MYTTDSTADSLLPYLTRVNAREVKARESLLAQAQERLRRMVKKAIRKFPGVWRWEDIEDVLQNVLVRLDKALREVAPPTPADFLALAAAHIRWELIDMSRRHDGPAGLNSRYITPPSDEHGERRPVNPPGPVDDPLGLEVWRELHERIRHLPDGMQRLFDALFYRGLPQAEAATFLGMPLRTLRRRWQEARDKLAKEFGDDLPGLE